MIDRVRALAPHVVVRGNHDKAVCGVMDLLAFNSHAREAAEWTTRALSEPQLAYLRDLPAGPLLVDDVLEVWHGSPADEDAYLVWIDDIRDAAALGTPPVVPVRAHPRAGRVRIGRGPPGGRERRHLDAHDAVDSPRGSLAGQSGLGRSAA